MIGGRESDADYEADWIRRDSGSRGIQIMIVSEADRGREGSEWRSRGEVLML